MNLNEYNEITLKKIAKVSKWTCLPAGICVTDAKSIFN